jgi:hypothetical protein
VDLAEARGGDLVEVLEHDGLARVVGRRAGRHAVAALTPSESQILKAVFHHFMTRLKSRNHASFKLRVNPKL